MLPDYIIMESRHVGLFKEQVNLPMYYFVASPRGARTETKQQYVMNHSGYF